MWEGAEGEGERRFSRAWSHAGFDLTTLEIMTQAETKNRMLNRLCYPGPPLCDIDVQSGAGNIALVKTSNFFPTWMQRKSILEVPQGMVLGVQQPRNVRLTSTFKTLTCQLQGSWPL